MLYGFRGHLWSLRTSEIAKLQDGTPEFRRVQSYFFVLRGAIEDRATTGLFAHSRRRLSTVAASESAEALPPTGGRPNSSVFPEKAITYGKSHCSLDWRQ